MDIVCEHCKSKFKVPDDKIPAGKIASFPCPRCKEKITVQPAAAVKKNAGTPQPDPRPDDPASGEYEAVDKPFNFAEEEGKKALVCESNPAVKKTLLPALENMDYHITDAKDTADALGKIRLYQYNVILVNEDFDAENPDANTVLAYLERLSMVLRRKMYIVLISQRFRTMDNMMAFNKSVNMVLNLKNVGDLEKILRRGITENDFFYNVFNETLKKIGKA